MRVLMECVHTWKNALQSKGERFDSFAFLLLQPASRRVEARGGGVHRRRVRNTRFSLVLTSVAGLPVLLLAIESPIPGIGRDGAEEKKKEQRVAGKKCLGRWTRAKNAGCEVVKKVRGMCCEVGLQRLLLCSRCSMGQFSGLV